VDRHDANQSVVAASNEPKSGKGILTSLRWWDRTQCVQHNLPLALFISLPNSDVIRKPPLRIWLDIGTKEGRDKAEAQRTVDGARLLKTTLIRKGWKDSKDLKYFEAEGAEHNEKAWAARTPEILEFLFPKKM
jgi:hypothetical protein